MTHREFALAIFAGVATLATLIVSFYAITVAEDRMAAFQIIGMVAFGALCVVCVSWPFFYIRNEKSGLIVKDAAMFMGANLNGIVNPHDMILEIFNYNLSSRVKVSSASLSVRGRITPATYRVVTTIPFIIDKADVSVPRSSQIRFVDDAAVPRKQPFLVEMKLGIEHGDSASVATFVFLIPVGMSDS